MYVARGAVGDLGFSLRPPRWARKMRPSKWQPAQFVKAAGVIAAAATAPIWLPAAAGVALTAAGAGSSAAIAAARQLAARTAMAKMPTGDLIKAALAEVAPKPGLALATDLVAAPEAGKAEEPPKSTTQTLPILLLTGFVLLLFLRRRR